MSQWLTISEVAKHFGTSRDTVGSWIRSGELQAINVARSGARYKKFKVSAAAVGEFERLRAVGSDGQQVRARRRSAAKQVALRVTRYSGGECNG